MGIKSAMKKWTEADESQRITNIGKECINCPELIFLKSVCGEEIVVTPYSEKKKVDEMNCPSYQLFFFFAQSSSFTVHLNFCLALSNIGLHPLNHAVVRHPVIADLNKDILHVLSSRARYSFAVALPPWLQSTSAHLQGK